MPAHGCMHMHRESNACAGVSQFWTELLQTPVHALNEVAGCQCKYCFLACTGKSPTQVQAHGAALLPRSPEDEPIGCRTRTRLPMQHISLDDLDGLLAEEGDALFDEEGEQYQQFLRVCHDHSTKL